MTERRGDDVLVGVLVGGLVGGLVGVLGGGRVGWLFPRRAG
jgi:gas vesicle protein